MKTIALRMYGKMNLKLEKFEFPDIKEGEILAEVISDTSCPSTYKEIVQGEDHPRVPKDISKNPVIVGHEMAGRILKVGRKWKEKFGEGQKFTVQPAINYKEGPVGILSAPGYSYRYIGGLAAYVIIPNEVMKKDCLLTFEEAPFYKGSLVEPLSCNIGSVKVQYHTEEGIYEHKMGVKGGGKTAILGGAGPMGMGLLAYLLTLLEPPESIILTDIDDKKLERAKKAFLQEGKKKEIRLQFINPIKDNSYRNSYYDDVFILYASSQLVEEGDSLLARDGCLNLFAGPMDHDFSAEINFFKVHYEKQHFVAVTGGNDKDMKDALKLIIESKLDPSCMVTHVGGINTARDVLLNFPKLGGGKKLIYTHLNFPLINIEDLEKLQYKGEKELRSIYKELYEIIKKNSGWWCPDAEKYLLSQKQLEIKL